jgi:hypothetical protein
MAQNEGEDDQDRDEAKSFDWMLRVIQDEEKPDQVQTKDVRCAIDARWRASRCCQPKSQHDRKTSDDNGYLGSP